jgi:outer membrane immunogenic protein
MKKFLAVAILAGSSLSAQAADIVVKAPVYKAPEAKVYDWTGFYVGVNVGVGLGRNLTQDTISNGLNPPTLFVPQSYLGPIGAIGGGQIGYNWQISNVVLGLETDIQAAGMTDNQTCVHPGFIEVTCPPVGPGLRFNQKLDWFGTARVRAGLATGPVLSYLTGGFAYGGASTTVTDDVFAFGPATSTVSGTRTGWAFGSGVEASLGGNWTAKAEYLYLNLGTQAGNYVAVLTGIGSSSRAYSSDIHENVFRAGLNYRLGGNRPYSAPVANWAGGYFGGNLGGALARDVSNNTRLGVGTPTSDNFNLMPSGFLGGAQAGYNWQAASWVFGLEADIQGSTQRDNKACQSGCSSSANIGLNSDTYDQRLSWLGTARGRIGYSLGATLFYGTGGAAFGGVKTGIVESTQGVPTVNASINQTRFGWTVGGGIESPFEFFGLFGKNWTSKTEYLYVDLGTSSGGYANVPLLFTYAVSTCVTEHIFRTGLNYHFNSPVMAKY